MEESSRLQEIRFRLEAKVERLSQQYKEAKRKYESVVDRIGNCWLTIRPRNRQ